MMTTAVPLTPEQNTALAGLADSMLQEQAAMDTAERARADAEAAQAAQAKERAKARAEATKTLRAALVKSCDAFNAWIASFKEVHRLRLEYAKIGGPIPSDLIHMRVSRSVTAALFAITGNTRFGRMVLNRVSPDDATASWGDLIPQEKTDDE